MKSVSELRQWVDLALDDSSIDYTSLENGPIDALLLDLWSAKLEQEFLRSDIAKNDNGAKNTFAMYGRMALIAALDFIQAMNAWKDRAFYLSCK